MGRYGSLCLFCGRFDLAGVPGYRFEVEGQPKYYRVLESLNAATEDDRERVLNVLGEGVLRNAVMRVVTEGELKGWTRAFRFAQSLRKRTHPHFA